MPLPTYYISETACDDWRQIALLTLKNEGEAAAKQLSKKFDAAILTMHRDMKNARELRLHGQSVRIIHCRNHFILGVLRVNKPVHIFAILHEKTEVMRKTAKKLRFFEKPYSHREYLESVRNKKYTRADYDALTWDDGSG